MRDAHLNQGPHSTLCEQANLTELKFSPGLGARREKGGDLVELKFSPGLGARKEKGGDLVATVMRRRLLAQKMGRSRIQHTAKLACTSG